MCHLHRGDKTRQFSLRALPNGVWLPVEPPRAPTRSERRSGAEDVKGRNHEPIRSIDAGVRYVFTVLGVLLVVVGLAGVKFKQISSLIAMGKHYEAAGPPPEPVGSQLATEQTWEGTISAIGSIAAVRGVALSNDSPGVVSKILFESGQMVHQGQVLVELDTSVERAQLASAEAKRDLAQINAKRTRALVEKAALAQSQLDNDDAVLKTSSTDLNAIQAQIDRKVVKAP